MWAFLRKISVFSLVIGVLFGNINCVKAFLLPPGPFTVTGDPLTDVGMVTDYMAQLAKEGAAEMGKVQSQLTKEVKAINDSYSGQVTGFMPTPEERKKAEKAVSGSKKIADCKIADIEKPSSVKKAFYKLFLAYPSDKMDINYAYQEKAKEFYQDTVIEAYVASRKMEEELNLLEKKFQDLSPSLVEGKDTGKGAEAGDDNNGTWKNAYTAYDIMNELLKITEELTAIRAQLDAAYAAYKIVPPASKSKGEKSSGIYERSKIQFAAQAVRGHNEVLAFAQLVDFNNFQKTTISSQPVVSSNGGATITSFAQQKQKDAVKKSRQEAIGLFSNANTTQKASLTETNSEEKDEEYEYDPTTASLVTYIDAPKPDISSPFAGNEEKMEELNKLDSLFEKARQALEVHNLLQALPTYKENAEKYNRFKQLHDKSVEMLKTSDKCVLQYLERYYTDPEKVWTGGPIPEENISNYDLRSGISAWAIAAFEVAKAEKTAGIDSDDGIVREVEIIDTTDMSKRRENEKKHEAASKDKINPGDQEKTEAINRETELVGWKIGAEAMKKLAEDQYSSNPQWGNVKKKFPIWNDQKNFYNQYINGKYNNIKEYISSIQFNKAALEVAQELNNILIEDEELQAYNANELSKLSSYVGEDDYAEDASLNEATMKVAEQKKAAMDNLAKERDSVLKPLEEQRKSILSSIDTEVSALNNFNERINQLKQEKMKAQSDIEDFQVQLEQADDVAAYGKANGEDSEGDSVAQIMAKENIKQSQEKEAAAGPEIERYQGLAKTQEEKINDLKGQLEEVEEQIKNIEEKYVREVQKLEESYTIAFEAARQKDRENKITKSARTLLKLYQENVENTGLDDLIGTSSVKGIISQAEGLVGDTKNYAAQAIENARADIFKLGDNLYLPSASEMVVKRHAELMRDLQNISAEELTGVISSLNELGTGVTQTLTTLFQKLIIQKACAENRCQTADTEYFLGLIPKDKDFAAPKAAPEMYMPPAREVIRFDAVNYDNVPQTTDGIISREDFINYGEEIPLIWKEMLKTDIFVEQGANLSNILEYGNGREASFMRGGRYPCLINNRVIDVDPYTGQYMVVKEEYEVEVDENGNEITDNDSSVNEETQKFLEKLGVYVKKRTKKIPIPLSVNKEELPPCQEIELIENVGPEDKVYFTIRDIEADTVGPAAEQLEEKQSNSSELGVFLKDVDNGGIRFADKPLEVFERLKEIEKESEENNEEYKANLKDEIYNNTLYNTNQIGDFLNYVEVETTYRQALEELEASLDEANNMLKEQLTAAGFEPAAEFNISKEEDYELAHNNLDIYKNELVEEGFEKIADVNVSDNEVVEERLNKIKRIFTALRKDKDELLSLNENSPSDSELDEQIKTEEVNKSVVGEYDKKVEEEFQKQLNNFKPPYCAAY